MPRQTLFARLCLLAALGLVAGCTERGPEATPAATSPAQPSEAAQATEASPPIAQAPAAAVADFFGAQPVFADGAALYQPQHVTAAMAEAAGSATEAPNLALLEKALKTTLTPAQRAFLEENRFVLLDLATPRDQLCFGPGLEKADSSCGQRGIEPPDEMVALFDQFSGSSVDVERNQANGIYINPDIILHNHHVFFDRYMKRLETLQLYPLLQGILQKMQETAFRMKGEATTDRAKASLERVAGYLTLARVLLETRASDKPDVFDSPDGEAAWTKLDQSADLDIASFEARLAPYKDKLEMITYMAIQAELRQILAAKGVTSSPMFGHYDPEKPTDYTQFTPRSHYRETSLLRAYFRTMMLLGRQAFPLKTDEGLADSAMLAAVLTQSGAADDWAKLSDTTDFFAGTADDITYTQLQPIVGDAATGSPDALLSDANVEAMKAAAAKLPPPKVLSDVIVAEDMAGRTKEDLLRQTLGFRLFGQKFTFDAWALNRMTAGQEYTDVALPSTPTALFIASALGSDMADELLPEWVAKTGNPKLDAATLKDRLATIGGDLAEVTPAKWLSSVGSGWLWTLQPLLQRYGSGYPQFMQTAPYRRKNLQSALGSYAELKHDTLLYAKQSYAELGAGMPEGQPAAVVRGFVEPDLEYWARMIALTELTKKGLADRGLLDEEVGGRLDQALEALRFYEGLAKKELANEPITDAEYEELRTSFWKISSLISPFGGEVIQEDDKKSPIIADVHTDALEGKILYEATGKPLVMLAYVGDQASPRLVVGTALSHYEFTDDLAKRLTDQDWRAQLDSGQAPEPPFWSAPILPK